jgi:hypothetical protein
MQGAGRDLPARETGGRVHAAGAATEPGYPGMSTMARKK